MERYRRRAGDADHLTRALRALADPTRRGVFAALRARERCVRDLVAAEGLPQPLVSHHLRVLVAAGLVRARRWEGYTMYAVDAEGLDGARTPLLALLDADTLPTGARPGGNVACCQA